MKLSRHQLTMLTDFARQEMRDRKKDSREDGDEHLARCWMAAFIRMAAHGGKDLCLIKDNIVEVLDV